MVHGQYRVEAVVIAPREKGIGTVRAEYHHMMFGIFDRRLDDLFILFSDQALVTCMRVQTQHRDPRLIDAEVPDKAVPQDIQLGKDGLAGDMTGNILYRYV